MTHSQDYSGQTIAGFRLNHQIGAGNVGIVYHATQLATGKNVAFKLLKPEFSHDPKFIERFLREARLSARLNHPNIVQAIDAGYSPEGEYYFAMELVEGSSLETERLNRGKLPLEELFPQMLQIARAMAYAWDTNRIVHGDIKPENILLAGPGKTIKIADLGLAQTAGSSSGENVMATPLYAAPEIIARKQELIGPWSDIYSFGVMFYELATGTPPYSGSLDELLQQHLSGITRSLRERCPLPDDSLSDFVVQMLEKNPKYRPASWQEVIHFLSDYQQKYFSTASVQSRRIFKPVYLLLLIPVILLTAASIWFFRASTQKSLDREYNDIIKTSPVTEIPTEIIQTHTLQERKVQRFTEQTLHVQPTAPVRFAKNRRPSKPKPEKNKILPIKEKPAVQIKESVKIQPVKKEKPPVQTKPINKPERSRTVKKTPPPVIAKPHIKNSRNIDLPDLVQTAQQLKKLDHRFSQWWKQQVMEELHSSYLLQLEILPPPLKPVKITGIDSRGGRHPKWIQQTSGSGKIMLNSKTPPRKISRAIAHGVMERLIKANYLRRYKVSDFEEFFEYLQLEKAGIPQQPLRNNFYYDCCQGKKKVFIRKLHQKAFKN